MQALRGGPRTLRLAKNVGVVEVSQHHTVRELLLQFDERRMVGNGKERWAKGIALTDTLGGADVGVTDRIGGGIGNSGSDGGDGCLRLIP